MGTHQCWSFSMSTNYYLEDCREDFPTWNHPFRVPLKIWQISLSQVKEVRYYEESEQEQLIDYQTKSDRLIIVIQYAVWWL